MPEAVAPTMTTESFGGSPETEFKHDAFGIVRLSRVQIGGKGSRLFGSDLRHREVIAVEVCRASMHRQHSHEHVFGGEAIVRFEMSTAQWAQFISSQGVGGGTPITLERAPIAGTRLESMPDIAATQETVSDTFKTEFAAAAQKMAADVQKVEKLIGEMITAKKPASMRQLAELQNMLIHAGRNAPGNFEHIKDMFTEVIETQTLRAKAEVENFVTGMVLRTGIETLQKALPGFGNDEDRVGIIDQSGT